MDYVLVPKEWMERIDKRLERIEALLEELEGQLSEEVERNIERALQEIKEGKVKPFEEIEW